MESVKKRAKARGAQLSSGAAQTHPQLGAFFVIEFVLRLTWGFLYRIIAKIMA
ncbi:MAG: hypothetical protein VZQ47_11815 [Treponema sp.]|nr:hypothetical protein [Treponema sp.]MEE3436229.1 hypothetical protein [Treponema sp.]